MKGVKLRGWTDGRTNREGDDFLIYIPSVDMTGTNCTADLVLVCFCF